MAGSNDNEAPGLSALACEKRLYFIRHGKTAWNDQFRYQGATDIPLSDEGRRQANAASARFAKVQVDTLLCSPLSRAFETASIIAGAHPSLRPVRVPELTEVNFGGWEGLTVPQIKEKYGEELFARWRGAQLDVTAPMGEDMDALWLRSASAAERILSCAGKNIVVVGHGAMFRVLFLSLLSLPRTNIFWKTRLDNCSISAFSCDKEGRATLSYLNDVTHLKLSAKQIEILPSP